MARRACRLRIVVDSDVREITPEAGCHELVYARIQWLSTRMWNCRPLTMGRLACWRRAGLVRLGRRLHYSRRHRFGFMLGRLLMVLDSRTPFVRTQVMAAMARTRPPGWNS